MLVGHKNFDEKSFSSNFLREYNSEHSNSLIYSNFFKNTIILKIVYFYETLQSYQYNVECASIPPKKIPV